MATLTPSRRTLTRPARVKAKVEQGPCHQEGMRTLTSDISTVANASVYARSACYVLCAIQRRDRKEIRRTSYLHTTENSVAPVSPHTYPHYRCNSRRYPSPKGKYCSYHCSLTRNCLATALVLYNWQEDTATPQRLYRHELLLPQQTEPWTPQRRDSEDCRCRNSWRQGRRSAVQTHSTQGTEPV